MLRRRKLKTRQALTSSWYLQGEGKVKAGGRERGKGGVHKGREGKHEGVWEKQHRRDGGKGGSKQVGREEQLS